MSTKLAFYVICLEHGMMRRVNQSYLHRCYNCNRIVTDEMIRKAIGYYKPQDDDDYAVIVVR